MTTPAQCGTISGYKKHGVNYEPPCQPCRDAKSAYNAKYKSEHKEETRAYTAQLSRNSLYQKLANLAQN